LTDARRRTTKPFLAGLARETLLRGTPDAAAREALATLEEAAGHPVVVAPDCTISPAAPPANLAAVRDALLRAAA
jgi:hypothetical protein